MQDSFQSKCLTIAAWGFGIFALFPLVLIAGVCFVAPVDWNTRLIIITILVCISALMTFCSGWCFRRRDERLNHWG
jgi:membrane-bound acyltransferase YfiQ involved in biofilm formation